MRFIKADDTFSVFSFQCQRTEVGKSNRTFSRTRTTPDGWINDASNLFVIRQRHRSLSETPKHFITFHGCYQNTEATLH